MESFGRLGEEGYEFINEIATHAAGGRNGVNMNTRGIIKERILQVVSVATQTGGHIKEGAQVGIQALPQRTSRRQHANQEILSPTTWGWSLDEQ